MAIQTHKAGSSSQNAFTIGGIHDLYLRAFARYHYLTAQHLVDLYHQPGTYTTVSTRLKELSDPGHRYLLALKRPTKLGRSPYVYCLWSKGRAYVSELGMDTHLASFRPSKEDEHKYSFFDHILSTTDFLIKAELLCKSDKRTGQNPYGLRLDSLIHDLTLRSDPPMLRLDTPYLRKNIDGTVQEIWEVPVIPDGWLDFCSLAKGQESHFGVWLEMDLDSMARDRLRQRIRHLLLLWRQKGHMKHFGVRRMIIAFATPTGMTRVNVLRKRIREELETPDLKKIAERYHLFAVGEFRKTMTAEQLFLSKQWYTAHEHGTQIALWRESESGR